MHLQNRLFLTLESLTFNLFFLTVYYYDIYKQKMHAVTLLKRAHGIT